MNLHIFHQPCGLRAVHSSVVLAVCLACLSVFSSCQTNEYGTVDLSDYKPDTVATIVYNHPCALYTADDFARVKASLANGTAPAVVLQEFNSLKANRYVNGDYGVVTHAHEQIVRGSAVGTIEGVENYADAMRDAASAYQFGLLWQLTGDEQYAKKGITILKAWVATCKEVWAADNNYYLAAGAQGFTFALAGEQLRDYAGWSESEFTEFKNWMLNVFADKNYKFLSLHGNSTCGSPKHYMSNWDLVNLCSYLQIGILTENDDMVKYVVNYFTKNGDGNGSLANLVQYTYNFTAPDGTVERVAQAQESGRDQAHASMATAVVAQLAQAAWALYQGNPTYTALDFFSANDNALLQLAEYTALANLKTGTRNDITIANDKGVQGGSWLYEESQIPFTVAGPWCSNTSHEAGKTQNAFGSKDRGEMRPGWEILNSHYKGQAGSYFTRRFAGVTRPEGGAGDERYGVNSGAFDQIGWGTLMLYSE